MPPDAAASPTGPDVGRRSVAAGGYLVEVGDPAGIRIEAASDEGDPRGLARAIAQAEARMAAAQAAPEPAAEQRERSPAGLASLEHATEDALQITSAIELARSVFEEIIHGDPGVGVIDSAIEALLGTLKRLELGERWAEALKLARELARLLALVERWVALWESLQGALTSAKRLKDAEGKAWVLHEQGTLQLAAGNHARADELLSEAHQLRQKFDRASLRVTENNLRVLCETLRARLHERRTATPGPLQSLLRKPVAVLACAMLLLVVGGAAGAALPSASKHVTIVNARSPAVEIEISPSSPRAGDIVSFRVSTEHRARITHYAWLFGDGDRTVGASPTHVYATPGTYTARVSVSATGETATASGQRRILVSGATGGESSHVSITPKRIEVNATPNPVPSGTAAVSITARAFNVAGEPISGQPVRFAVKPRDGTFSSVSASTNAEGSAQTSLSFISTRTADVVDAVEACATTGLCNTVDVEWTEQATPVVATLYASDITSATATLNGTLNPNGVKTTNCHFEYGPSPGYGHETACPSFERSGTTPQDVAASLSNLLADTSYQFRLVAESTDGSSYGTPQAFTTGEAPPRPKPTVITGSPTAATASEESVSGSVDPNGVNVEDCEFQYGTSEAYGSQAKCDELPGAGTTAVTVSARLSGLAADHVYFYRLVATSAGGPGDGAAQSFRTPEAITSQATEVKTETSAAVTSDAREVGASLCRCCTQYSALNAPSSAILRTWWPFTPSGRRMKSCSSMRVWPSPKMNFR
jgi:PKD repeat protein